MPHLIELHKKYLSQGLVIIGIHTTRGAGAMAKFVEEKGIPYPVAADLGDKTTEAFKVDSFPDYYLIDRAGKLRFADLANSELDRAITTLLKEKAPKAKPVKKLDAVDVLKKAQARAKAENKNLLVHLGAPW